MGNKCCSKRQDQELALAYPTGGYKKSDYTFGQTHINSNSGGVGGGVATGLGQKHNNGGSLDSRYTPDPNRGPLKIGAKGGVDIIRTRTTPTAGVPGGLPKRRVVVALYDYKKRDESDLSFMKGDRMEVIDDTESDWWRVVNLSTRQEGLIPLNFVAEERSVNSEDWFFENVLRKEADKLLLAEENPRGTFLVRPSEHNPNGYSLSVKDWEDGRGYHVKHYRIKPLDNGGYYIATNQTFPSLQALVMAYSKNALGLCHILSRPCPKPQPQMWDLGPELRDKYEIPRSEIQLVRKLGRGNFGEVFYGKWRNSIDVAVKTLREGTMSTAAFLQEAAIMKKFRHNRLVALYAVCSQEEPIYIVQEFMSKGSLLDFLREGDGRYLHFEDLIYIATQVASGMEYLESKQLIHRDLAARNVLIGENNVAKICDFGLARVIADDEYCPKQGSRFPVKWTAPEAIIYGKFSIKSDVWSYGILLMELFTYGQVPYPGMHSREVIENIERGFRMPKPTNHYFPDNIYHLLLQCWDAVPEKRPTFEFLNHYFESFSVTSEVPYREVQD
ncbi:tyrosine-protein kinase Src64B isoform X1 [Drosophila sulfurigaster albostrigata]|uniref:Tyrosine-protein kinase n=1 Tax=Drosophila albomicans TaxID=7291 RepID=A0A6P8X0H6_DROAB|nr:tyrosine-protein kinase Src64B isoform X1 [Drosophila albomicans]XP_034105253.1 tyrosine-protein kinase Src64B isoform X1 [Drosophila albomicans]XP_060660954.1 tyrosine-protein kinase Src64B isoform X1 [Drosophila nasuta]XP_060660956.1 tyrosine-protein kinase Src64B isoform X1 [Drosophila nasuta]XP_062135013.1 tyrosine-protein kinase Src64B isoform X1 [Drosophila sulfurigaster albostrigata]XP_062135014.1 tyrosine-protein kinase Src64B isoform X1 [Drosophila sulfurigaster albostrigata]